MFIEFNILYAIQSIRTDFLDSVVVFITNFIGKNAEIWLILGIALLIFKKTRKVGLAILLSYGLTWVICQDVIKDIICRPRPCHIDETIKLIVSRPSSYSCPSTHSALAAAMAASVYFFNKKYGVVAIIVALIIGLSRMYLFVHFPTDVLFGYLIGIIAGIIAGKAVDIIARKVSEKTERIF